LPSFFIERRLLPIRKHSFHGKDTIIFFEGDLGQFKIRVGLQSVNRGVEVMALVEMLIFSDGSSLELLILSILRLVLQGSCWLSLWLCQDFSRYLSSCWLSLWLCLDLGSC